MKDSKNPVRVLHVIDSLGAGGAETWLLECVRYLHANPEIGVRFDFLATSGEKRIFDDEMLRLGSKIFYVKFSNTGIFKFRREYISILKSGNYAAIHSHQDFVSGWHYLLAWGYCPKIRIAHLHNSYEFVLNYSSSLSRKASYRIGRFLMGVFATHITGTSNAVMDQYGYTSFFFKRKRIAPCYCGFSVENFSYNCTFRQEIYNQYNWPPEAKVALFIGRLDLGEEIAGAKNQKNPSFAFEIAKQLTAKDGDWKFVFVGEKGGYGRTLEAEIKELGLSDKVKFLGIRRDIPKLMSASDILIFPSLFEGLGMVVVEAQATGLPVLKSDTVPQEAKVIPELVFEKSLQQSPEEWVKEILEIAKEKKERTQYNSVISSSMFSIQNSVFHLLATYNLL